MKITKIAGIIAEYHPFHNGHAWQMARLREMGYEAVVCAMSPSVVQRGQVAVLPVGVRAEACLLYTSLRYTDHRRTERH